MKASIALGLSVLAGAALLEAALVPAVVIGGAVVLAPKYLARLHRQRRPSTRPMIRQQAQPMRLLPARAGGEMPVPAIHRLTVKRAIAKTVTFRVIVTSLDFTANYVMIGELAAAAGLSAFALVAGPVFYLAHEMAWDRFGPPRTGAGASVVLKPRSISKWPRLGTGTLSINRPLAKTITFRTAATVMDFTTNYVVIGDLATAATLSAFGFVVGPFVYLGHELIWDRYGSPAGHHRSAGAGPDGAEPRAIGLADSR